MTELQDIQLLSHKILKLCKCKPSYKVTYTYFGETNEVIYEDLTEAMTEAAMLKGQVQIHYSDLSKPENFIQLQLIKQRKDGYIRLGSLYGYCWNKLNPIKEFLNDLLQDLKGDQETESIKYIKQRIKQTKWVK